MNFNKNGKTIVEPILIFFGFTIKKDMTGIIEYGREDFAITMLYDYNSSFEVEMTFLYKESELFYSYNELKQYFNNTGFSQFVTQITDEDTLIKWLESVAQFLRENLNTVIDDCWKIQIGLRTIRQDQIEKYEFEKNFKMLNKGVEKYWSTKDYLGLVKFVKTYDLELLGSIKKKLEYACKMIEKH